MTAPKGIAAQTSVTTSGGDLTVTGGTPATLKGTGSATVSTAIMTNGSYTPPKMTASVNVTATTGGNLVLAPVTTTTGALLTIKAGNETTTCTYVSADPTSISIPVQTGGGGGTNDDVVAYNCTLPSGTDADYPASVDIKVVMTPPTSASANADASISWTGTIQSTGEPLKVPTGFPTTSPKMFVTVKASGAGAPTTATGEGTLTTVTVGSNITTLPNVTVKVKPTTTGTVSLTAGDLAFGTSATSPFIKCTAPTTGLKAYTFTVGNSTTSPSPTTTSPTPTTTSPRPTTTRTATLTITPSKTHKSQTPKAGADTGAGGTMGPDGRLFILTGTGLVAAAAIGGLVMRRRSVKG
ncbi:hypothetical protein ACGFJC_16500 [Nonomuraea fuscirosea]|uniref:hypothetical protein n=1 Tax=Nonomuraea fuscirosea TaxID=1291556 RepID=UPI00371B8A00